MANVAIIFRERGWLPELERMCRTMHVTVEQVAGRDKHKSIARARREVWRWLYVEQKLSWVEIATIFGRDHTSVLSTVRGRSRKRDPEDRDITVDKIAAWIERLDLDEVTRERSQDTLGAIAALIRAGAWK